MSAPAVAIDSTLLLLLVVGMTGRDYVGRHKRLKAFSIEDFDLLVAQLQEASSIVLTPNTLTETSNFIDHIGNPVRGEIYGTLRRLLSLSDEAYVPSRRVAENEHLTRLGIADCALLDVCASGAALMTADLALYLAALGRGASAVNFHHLRSLLS